MNKKRVRNNIKGQITIFIILGLIIIVTFIIIFLLRNPPKVEILDENNPQAYIETCTREAVEDALSILSPQGGDIDPKGYITFNGTDIVYICYSGQFYRPCINQRPLLVEHIETEITNYITPIVRNCFQTMEFKLKKRYDIETGDMQLTTRIFPKQISVDIYKKFKMTRETTAREFNHFKMNMQHPIYNFADIAMEVANQETHYCNFDNLGFMILYPDYDITRFTTGDEDRIYVITERVTNQKFRFAIKSCWLPAGF